MGIRRLQLESLEQRALLSVTIGTNQPITPPAAPRDQRQRVRARRNGAAQGDAYRRRTGTRRQPLAGCRWRQLVHYAFPRCQRRVARTDLDGKVDGNIQTSWYVNPTDETDATMQLSATGLTSGETATTTFTDASTHVTSVSTTANYGASFGQGSALRNQCRFQRGRDRDRNAANSTEHHSHPVRHLYWRDRTSTLAFTYTVQAETVHRSGA